MYVDSETSKNFETVVLENVTVSWELTSQPLPEQMPPEPGNPQCMRQLLLILDSYNDRKLLPYSELNSTT